MILTSKSNHWQGSENNAVQEDEGILTQVRCIETE